MNAITEIAYLSEPEGRGFEFLSKLENFPTWATEFCEGSCWVDGKFKVLRSSGDLFCRFDADSKTGVIDMWFGLTENAMMLFPVRVIGLPEGKSAAMFTLFQPPTIPDKMFRQQCASLRRELDRLPELIRQAG